jgi:hypothetical protein
MKEKQSTRDQHMWELLQGCWKSIPGEAGWENAKSVQSKGYYLENLKYNIAFYFLTLFWLLHDSTCVIS